MKKLMILFIVLGLVSVANAGVIDITITSLNGETITPTKEITIMPTDMIDFQIMFNGPVGPTPPAEYLFGLSATINVVGPGSLDYSQFEPRTWDPDAEAWVIGPDVTAGYDPDLHAQIGNSLVEGATARGKKGTGAEVWIVKDLLLHCDKGGTVLLYLTNYLPGGGSKVIDVNYNEVPWQYGAGVIIHQIPEPMTLTLLGLGSLFLARRKK